MNDYFRTEGESPVDEVQEVAYAENEFDFQYKDNIRYILSEGEERTDRTGVRTISKFGDVGHKIDLRRAYPGTTLKRLAFKAMKVETIDWMLQGKFDLKTLKDKGVRIWDQNVIPGTEVYRELSVQERLGLLTEKQKESFDAFREELRAIKGLSSTEYEDAFHAKLNNWGIKEEELIDGALGRIYGAQWRDWHDIRIVPSSELDLGQTKWVGRGFNCVGLADDDMTVLSRSIDQVADVEKAVKNRSDSRRIILTGWNVAQLDEMSLPPCHTMAQWYVSQKRDENGLQYLDCKMYQRSADFLLGVPFNVAQYAMMTEMLAKAHGLRARFLHHTIGDAHIYLNHLEEGFVAEVMARPVIHKSPKLQITGDFSSMLDIRVEDVSMVGYESHEAQKNVPIAK